MRYYYFSRPFRAFNYPTNYKKAHPFKIPNYSTSITILKPFVSSSALDTNTINSNQTEQPQTHPIKKKRSKWQQQQSQNKKKIKYFNDLPTLSSITLEKNTTKTKQSKKHNKLSPKSSNSLKESTLNIAIEGCSHGSLDKIYSLLLLHELKTKTKIDLLIICGDFQSIRNVSDLSSLHVPPKYKTMGDFPQYYSGHKVAPIKTLFVGGNHENSHQLQELFYGGWVCPHIYYLGHANVVHFCGIRIASISGVYSNETTYSNLERREYPPYDHKSIKQVYHTRRDAIYRLGCLSPLTTIDLMISHDWPRGIEQYGNVNKLLRVKPHFKQDIKRNTLGNPKTMELLHVLQPTYWFSAHLHVDFEATVEHNNTTNITTNNTNTNNTKKKRNTYFRALDKVIPKRKFIRILSFPNTDENNKKELEYDLEWLSILKKTHSSFSTHAPQPDQIKPLPPISISNEEKEEMKELLQDNILIPDYFQPTVPFYNKEKKGAQTRYIRNGDPQTDTFLKTLGMDHSCMTIPYREHDHEHDALSTVKNLDDTDVEIENSSAM